MERSKFYNSLKVLTASRYTVVAIVLLIFLLLVMIFFKTEIEYGPLIKEMGNINITVGIGLGAIALAISQKVVETDFIWTILVMLLLGIMSFILYVARLEEYIYQIYFFLNVIVSVSGIVSFSVFYFDITREKDKSLSSSKKANKK